MERAKAVPQSPRSVSLPGVSGMRRKGPEAVDWRGDST